MNFQQLRSVRETVRSGFNLTEAAQTLRASQSGVSRQIRDLEQELGIELFVRSGKRLTGLTPPGDHLLPIIERVLAESRHLQQAGHAYLAQQQGVLSVAATHSQARYALPRAVQEFRLRFPGVRLHLHQGSPKQVAQMLQDGEADVGIATEALADHSQLLALPCRCWRHVVIAPLAHPLLRAQGPLTLEQLAAWPLITYDNGLTGRSRIDDAFARAGLAPEIVLAAMDADVIKTYVALGMGVGIVADLACDAERDTHLGTLDAGHLFGVNQTKLAVRRGGYLRSYVYAFIECFAPDLPRPAIELAAAAANDA
ncbi:CysB family HTH-type transcriptional regulator [Variovorax sp. J22G73]|uniref:CysB family HTH-type transcriptional regulator n=1 Tax=unclassified Variovorax TaxID=663243 RepID=UPI002575516F|nr:MULTISPECIES: CysB family HTH-type transcriptional regulator [unclassified Variovorax]MDM0008121.1 CysB family HTH-type transcriptional regulator [Variovorax sp. J22R203]MDM0100627.1 CysB family HTH-type transcriptional regulator [Variovorax sp. J22G73]